MCTVNSVEDAWHMRSHELSSVLCEAGTFSDEGENRVGCDDACSALKEVVETGIHQG